MIKRVIEREGESSLEAGVLDASGNNQDNWDGGVGSGDIGVSWEGSTRGESLMLQEGDLIVEMEREAMEAGAGGGTMGWIGRLRRVGVGPTPTHQPVRIESGQLS